MSGAGLQEAVDRLRATSRQRWWLGAVAVAAGVGSAAAIPGDGAPPWAIGLVAVLAVAAVVVPDSPVGAYAIGVVLLYWVLAVDEVTTPSAVVVAAGLLVFHVVLALTAATPATVTIDGRSLRRWAVRTALVVAATAAMWALVAAFDRWPVPGGAALTLLAFGAAAAGAFAVLLRVRS